MPKNEPVKLVYPTSNNNNQTSTIVTMNNNRVTFSSAPVQNGTITLSPMTGQQQQMQMQGNIKIQQQQGQPALIFKNNISSAPGTMFTTSPVTMSKANNQVSYPTEMFCVGEKKVMAMTRISDFRFSSVCALFIGAKL